MKHLKTITLAVALLISLMYNLVRLPARSESIHTLSVHGKVYTDSLNLVYAPSFTNLSTEELEALSVLSDTYKVSIIN